MCVPPSNSCFACELNGARKSGPGFRWYSACGHVLAPYAFSVLPLQIFVYTYALGRAELGAWGTCSDPNRGEQLPQILRLILPYALFE